MFCNVCKNEWNGSPDDTRCPHCGADLKKNAEKHTIPGVIAFLIEKEGADVLLKPERVMSFISDLVQGNEREKKLVRVGSVNGAFQKAHALLEEPKLSKREVMVLEMRHYLMDSAFLSEENAVLLVNILLDGIGMPSLRLNSAQKKAPDQPQKKTPPKVTGTEQKKNAPPTKSAPVQPKKPAPKKQAPVNSAPNTAGVTGKDKQKSQNTRQSGGFRLNSLSTFEYDGVSFASQKVDGSLFLKGEARMIGILVTYDPVPVSMNVSLDWQIFRQDGSPLTGLIHGMGVVNRGDTDFYQGWGWAVPGNWETGRYTVKASMNGSGQLTTYFDIVDGCYDNPRLTMNSLKLFSAGGIPPAISERKYFTAFSSHQARRIYFEISFARINAPVYTTMRYKITRDNGEIVANYAIPIRLRNGDTACWTGFGWENPGHWKKGRYGYEVTLGKSNNIFRGIFDIV